MPSGITNALLWMVFIVCAGVDASEARTSMALRMQRRTAEMPIRHPMASWAQVSAHRRWARANRAWQRAGRHRRRVRSCRPSCRRRMRANSAQLIHGNGLFITKHHVCMVNISEFDKMLSALSERRRGWRAAPPTTGFPRP